MFTTCMFCKRPLGSNEVIGTFPVGRRLAFDAGRGRLWVVCRKCERWNLTPLEERWEAVEDCERIFRGTHVRVSTDNIGLARHPEGLTLVRIGAPLRPEFAAWRYGDQFGRRRRKVAVTSGIAVAAAAGLAVGGLAAGLAISTSLIPIHLLNIYSMRVGRIKLRLEDGRALVLQGGPRKYTCRLRRADGDAPGVRIQVGRFSLRRGVEESGSRARRPVAHSGPSSRPGTRPVEPGTPCRTRWARSRTPAAPSA